MHTYQILLTIFWIELPCEILASSSDKATASFKPVFDPVNNSATCAVDTPSKVFSLADASVGIPVGVPGATICGFMCSGYMGCLSYNYREETQPPVAQCELYTYPPRNCTTFSTGICQHYEIPGQVTSSCKPIVAGGWSSWAAHTKCTVTGQTNYTEVRLCNSPKPSNGGTPCIASTSRPALIEYRLQPCGCDPICNSVSNCTLGYRLCDSSCGIGYGIVGRFCQACNTTGCNDSCNSFGPGTCDGLCLPGYSLHPTSHTCIPFRYRSIGCYADNQTRDLSGPFIKSTEMTLSLCAQFCHDKGFRYAGAQASYWCLCGNTFGRYNLSSKCGIKCSGDSSQICGAGWTNSVMEYPCDPNCGDADDCVISGVGKCDNHCKDGWSKSQDNTCSNCPPGYTFLSGGDNCYMFVNALVTYEDAYKGCNSINTGDVNYDVHLAYIETEQENAAIYSLIGSACPVFIGGCHVNNHDNSLFVWTRHCVDQQGPELPNKNSTFSLWTYWDPNGLPFEWCFAIFQCSNGEARWADEPCTNRHYYLCEIEV